MGCLPLLRPVLPLGGVSHKVEYFVIFFLLPFLFLVLIIGMYFLFPSLGAFESYIRVKVGSYFGMAVVYLTELCSNMSKVSHAQPRFMQWWAH